MSHFKWENLDDFLSTDDFASQAVITLAAGGIRRAAGIYDDPYLNAQLGEYEADSSDPRFTCKASDVVGVKRGDVFQLLNEAGQPCGDPLDILTDAQPDGTGMAVLKMAHQPA